ncbi:MAG: glycosyltransferase family 4 protein [Dietzia maris]
MKILLAATTGVGAKTFYQGFGKSLRAAGISATLVCPDSEIARDFAADEAMGFIPVGYKRDPSLSEDLVALSRSVRAVNDLRPDLVVSGSPKASLLTMISARIVGVESLYVVHGLRYEGDRGLRRLFLMLLEAVTCSLARNVVLVGEQLRDRMVADRMIGRRKAQVLGAGSANGVVVPISIRQRDPQQDKAGPGFRFGFVGRVTKDKGVLELVEAWERVAVMRPGATLIVVGQIENDLKACTDIEEFFSRSDVDYRGYITDPLEVYTELDCLVLPSYREGLPTVVLEAAARRVPAIVSDATGVSEPVLNGVTGTVVPARSAEALLHAMIAAIDNPSVIREMGIAARDYVARTYDRSKVHQQWVDLFLSVGTSGELKKRGK